MISIFDLFSIGIGPSSSHTVGPMRAAYDFIQRLGKQVKQVNKLRLTIYGSLAYTGLGHGTDKALFMGLEGEQPEHINPDLVPNRMKQILSQHEIKLLGKHTIKFDPANDLVFDYKESHDFHPNSMKFSAFDKNNNPIGEAVYFSIGGGFIIHENEIPTLSEHNDIKAPPFPFTSGAELLELCEKHNKSISELILENELTWRDQHTINQELQKIITLMQECIKKGCETSGELPGKLGVTRRANSLYKQLLTEGPPSALHPQRMNWLNVFAMAVNEENAAGGRVVTAPTNGAAGIIPSVMRYYQLFIKGADEQGTKDYLLTAAAIGMLYKMNASISGAEMGCQGEVGVACSMAAAGFAAALGGTPQQVENAAEIGMEHNLGLTCDPVNGLVQIPCIERNAMAAVKAVNAAQLALSETGSNIITLDMVIHTMREIGENMNSIYKETSLGGLHVAVNRPEC